MRPKKEPRESFGSTLRKELMEDLRKLSVDTDVPISKLLDQAVELLLTKRGATRDANIRATSQRNVTKEDVFYVDINLDDK